MDKKLDGVLLLATAHNITKAYINKLSNLGLRPSRIIRLNWRNSSYSNKVEGLSDKKFSNLISGINNKLKAREVFTGDLTLSTERVLDDLGWERQNITIDHINDEKLKAFLRDSVEEKYTIFCGGGILRRPILNCGKKFIHIHPGLVPDVRGADCLLWSALVQNQIGMSAFFMNAGIDTGDVIGQRSYPLPHFDIDSKQLGPNVTRDLLINYVDPHYRAHLLGNLFDKALNPDSWASTSQDLSEGKSYYFMHDALLPQAINKFCQLKMKMVG
ncbi:hypothetical protein LQ318_11760 [Aliifodinibius salicampi]|uniref:Formyl transferase N-terminal domain-containing protein n=1 Tax=Fodinibius salicampi TaxID=1920655 RepID=A0ABT3Q0G0_9BACT|nr:formyltransferase family protein [Fodinibius salicampi]MCW9713576.1 hypothetical protein [Fodinibius salicampi]